MRMRRKRNLDARLEGCGDRIIYMDRDQKNFQDKSEKSLIDYAALFGNSNPVILEIGCGKGQFAIEFAKTHPDVNVLAVEKSSNVIVDALLSRAWKICTLCAATPSTLTALSPRGR